MNSGSDEPEQVESVSYFEENNKKKTTKSHVQRSQNLPVQTVVHRVNLTYAVVDP